MRLVMTPDSAVTGRRFQTLVALLLSALWAIALGYGHVNGDVKFLDRAEGALTDLRLLVRGERAAPDLLTIVAIDDDTAAKKGGYPLPRTELARLVEAIARFEPRVIALDLLLVDRGNDAGDAALARALKKRPTVIAAAAVFPEAIAVDRRRRERRAGAPAARAEIPAAAQDVRRSRRHRRGQSDHRRLRARRAALPCCSAPATRSSCRSRCAPLDLPTAEPTIEANGLMLGARQIATDIDHVLPLAFYGRHGTIRTVSAVSLLNGEIDPGGLRDHIVVIGAT